MKRFIWLLALVSILALALLKNLLQPKKQHLPKRLAAPLRQWLT